MPKSHGKTQHALQKEKGLKTVLGPERDQLRTNPSTQMTQLSMLQPTATAKLRVMGKK